MIESIRRIQLRDELSDTEVGRRLGVSRSRWNAIRNGKQTLSDNLAFTAAGVWPELTPDLIERAALAAPLVTNGRTKADGEAA